MIARKKAPRRNLHTIVLQQEVYCIFSATPKPARNAIRRASLLILNRGRDPVRLNKLEAAIECTGNTFDVALVA